MMKTQCLELNIDDASADMLAAQPGITPALVERVRRVSNLVSRVGQTASEKGLVVSCIKNHLEASGSRIDTSLSVNSIGLAYDVDSSTADCDLAALANNLTHAGGGRICLYGPPGTGKTAYARHIAHRLGKSLKVAPASALLSRYVGDTEKSIAKIFASAASQDAVLFFDEVDSLLTDRAGATRSWEVSQVNELLCQMERYDGVMIAATNQFDILDPAVMRRFDLKVKFDWLRPEHAMQLLVSSLASLNIALIDAATERIRTLGCLAPGDFALVLRQARFRPIQSCIEFVERLEAEHQIKSMRGRSIGFTAGK
jgi:hypothetical protein